MNCNNCAKTFCENRKGDRTEQKCTDKITFVQAGQIERINNVKRNN